MESHRKNQHHIDGGRVEFDQPRSIQDQMFEDWAAIGLRRLGTHLARWSEFEDYLDRRGDSDHNQERNS